MHTALESLGNKEASAISRVDWPVEAYPRAMTHGMDFFWMASYNLDADLPILASLLIRSLLISPASQHNTQTGPLHAHCAAPVFSKMHTKMSIHSWWNMMQHLTAADSRFMHLEHSRAVKFSCLAARELWCVLSPLDRESSQEAGGRTAFYCMVVQNKKASRT